MRIAYFGLPLAALLLLHDGFDIDIAILSRIDAPGRRRLAKKLGAERVRLHDQVSFDDLEERFACRAPDLLVSWFWTRKLPFSLVRRARLGGIGAHPSLLPRHRGPDPYFATIDQGDRITGVTVHRIDREYDTGEILASRAIAVDAGWNAWQLARRLDRPSLALLREVTARLRSGETIEGEKQDDCLASWAAAPSASDCAIRWSWTTDKVMRRIHALAPLPGALTEIHGRVVTLLDARPAQHFPRALLPGEAAVVADVAVVRTADGAVELVCGEVDGAVLDARGFARLVARGGELVIV